MPDRRALSRPGRAVGLVLLGCALAVLMHWPLASNLDGAPADTPDRLLQAWQVAWGGHALTTQPAQVFDTNTFYPLDNDLAFTDGLLGYAPAGLVGSGPAAAMVRFNLLVLFSYALAFAGAALLARELSLPWPAALVAGAAFAYAPYRLSHYNHLHVLSSGGIPLTLFLLLRGYRTGRGGPVLAGWVVAAWQVSIGFALGLQLAYLLGLLVALAGLRWLARGRPRPSRAITAASLVGVAIFAGWSALQAQPYLQVLSEYPEARRSPAVVELFSPPPQAFLAAPPQSATWAGATAPLRADLDWVPEMTLFPGLTVTILAVAGLAMPVLSPRRRWLLGLLSALTALLSLGYSAPGGRQVYDLLYDFLPGWQASRTPGRLFTLTTLGLALLAGAGAQGVARWLARRVSWSSMRTGAALSAVLLAVVLFEGRQELAIRDLDLDVSRAAVPAPQMHLPIDPVSDSIYVYLSTAGFPQIFNGYSGFRPSSYERIATEMETFPDPGSVRRLRSLGIATVVAHLDRVDGTPWEGVDKRSVAGLPLVPGDSGSVVYFHLPVPGDSTP